MNRPCLCAALVLLLTPVFAAPSTVNLAPAILGPNASSTAELPQLSSKPRVIYPEEMHASSEIGYVLVRATTMGNGWQFFAAGSHLPFTKAVIQSLPEFKMPPETPRALAPVWFPVIFNPGTSDAEAPEAGPRLLRVSPVLIPPDILGKLPDGPVVRVRLSLDETGAIKDVDLARPSDRRVLLVLQDALPQWRFAAARKGGVPVASSIECSVLLSADAPSRYRFLTIPQTADATNVPAYALMKVLALRPAAPADVAPTVVADFTVDADGNVRDPVIHSSNDPAFNEPALEAVRRWRWLPSLRNGQRVVQRKRLPVDFMAAAKPPPAASAYIPPKVLKQFPPVYPNSMRRSGISGEVTVEFIVDATGNVTGAGVVRSNNPAFEQPALDAVRGWKFRPATRDGRPVETRMQVPIVSSISDEFGERRELLEANRPATDKLKKLPSELRYDTPPRFVHVTRAVYPYALLRDGTDGRAVVNFVVDRRGRVTLTQVKSATRPEFGLALCAALEASRFEPALREGQAVEAALSREQEFNLQPETDLLIDRDERLLRLETKSPERILGPNKLDGALKPIVRRAPEFPLALRGRVQGGQAVVEFLVDEEGKPRLPRVVSATEPELGYAAVQAVMGWSFEPPLSNKKPAIARVQQPFAFRATDTQATPTP